MSHLMINQQNGMCAQRTQISLGIRPVWTESSLCAQWVAKDPSFLHADSEDSDQTGRMPRLIWVFAGRTCHFVGFVTIKYLSLSYYHTCTVSVASLQHEVPNQVNIPFLRSQSHRQMFLSGFKPSHFMNDSWSISDEKIDAVLDKTVQNLPDLSQCKLTPKQFFIWSLA